MDRITVGVAAGGFGGFALLYAPQPVLPQLAADYQVTPGHASLAVGVATGAVALGVIPLALLSEVVGRRRVMLISVVVAAVLGLWFRWWGISGRWWCCAGCRGSRWRGCLRSRWPTSPSRGRSRRSA